MLGLAENLNPLTQAGVGVLPPSCVNFSTNFSSLSGLTLTGNITPTVSGNQLLCVNSGENQVDTTYVQCGSIIGMPQGAVSVNIVSETTGGTLTMTYADYSVGFSLNATNYVRGTWKSLSNQFYIEIDIAGTAHSSLAPVSLTLTSPFTLAFSLVGTVACLWYQQTSTSPWVLITSYDLIAYYDFKKNGSVFVNTWKPTLSWITYSNSGTGTYTTAFANLKCGGAGAVGLRDICPVTTLAGAPVTTGSQVYFTATGVDGAATPFCGIFTYDTVLRQLAQVGVLFNNRITDSGSSSSVSNSYSSIGVTNNSVTVSTGSDLSGVIFAGDVLQFGNQTGTYYTVASTTSSTIVLNTAFTGSTNSNTTALQGVYQNDYSTHLVQDGVGGYHYFTTTFANQSYTTTSANINIVYQHTASNILTGFTTFVQPTQLSLPNTPSSGGTQDPFMVQSGTTYYLAYAAVPTTANTFYPALASSSSPPTSVTWGSVAVDTTSVPYGQPRVTLLDNQYFLLFSSNAGDCKVYDLTLSFNQRYTSPPSSSSRTSSPSLFPLGTSDYQLTFIDNVNTSMLLPGSYISTGGFGITTSSVDVVTTQDMSKVMKVGDLIEFAVQPGVVYTVASFGYSGGYYLHLTTECTYGSDVSTAAYPASGTFQQYIGRRYGLL